MLLFIGISSLKKRRKNVFVLRTQSQHVTDKLEAYAQLKRHSLCTDNAVVTVPFLAMQHAIAVTCIQLRTEKKQNIYNGRQIKI